MARRPRVPALLSAAMLAFVAVVAAAVAAAVPSDLAERLASSTRSDAEKARDAGRRPAEVVAFLGITPGMTVMDVIAAGGYYTEVLSIAVGPKGRVYAQNPEFVLKFRDGANDKAMTARLAADRLPNVERVDGDLDAIPVADGSVDAALTALNFHDIYNRGGEQAAGDFLTAIYRKLKPGGVLGIVDHDADPAYDNAKLHRIEKRRVLGVLEKTGFSLEAESELLASAADDHSQRVFAPGIRGNTDRFLLRLRKPLH